MYLKCGFVSMKRNDKVTEQSLSVTVFDLSVINGLSLPLVSGYYSSVINSTVEPIYSESWNLMK